LSKDSLITPSESEPNPWHYTRAEGYWDEAVLPSGYPRRHWRELFVEIGRMGFQQLSRRWQSGQQLIQSQGITYNVYGDPQGKERPWLMDPLPLVLSGLQQTLLLCLIVIPLGLVGGLIFALASLSGSRTVRWGMIVAIDFFRAVPPLVLLIFVYSGLPFAGIRLSPLTAVAVAFFLNTSSYYGEIYRAGLESVERGQWDAARSTGLSAFATLTHIVLPQAVRNVLPDLVSNTVEVVKLTSIASVVALPEMLYSADMARSVTFNTSPIVLAAAIYLVMLWPVVRLISRLERRMAS